MTRAAKESKESKTSKASKAARESRSRAARRGSPVRAPRTEGRLLADRYQLAGAARGSGVAAVDNRSGAEVQLDAVPLPETVEPFDQVAPDRAGGSDATASRALEQSALVARTVPDHPRLSQVFQVFEENGYLWVAGESVPGVQLSALLGQGPLSQYRAAELAHDLVAALRAVHAAGLVHGNLTADTVMVCDDGTALLGGLVVGTAQEALCGGPGAEQPGAGVPAGPWTPARVRARDARAIIVGAVPERWSPEQAGPAPGRPADVPPQFATGRPAGSTAPAGTAAGTPVGTAAGLPVGPEADAWALGVLLYRALTGTPPFPQEDTETLFAAVRAGELPTPARPALPARGSSRAPLPECGLLGPLVERLLRTDPRERPSLPEAAERIRLLLIRAPEPIDQDEVQSVAALLPVQRLRGDVLPHPDFPHHRHAAPRRRAALLGSLLVAGVVLFVLLALVIAVLLSR
ncbi:serine/threonine protein kinase [Streptacidiphilus sp. MAP12-16]|uniref:hypothetical protein n=1 Tax=Streptacidiphilus sp. MAP12-16 TaxID=3156300 RepID=UPI003512A2CD